MNEQKRRIMLAVRHPVGGILSYIKYIYGQDCFDEFLFTVLVPDPELYDTMEEVFRNNGLTFITFENGPDMVIKSWGYIRRNRVDLVHSHGFTAGTLMAPVAKYWSVEHLMTTHDILQEAQFRGIQGGIKKYILSMVYKYIDAIHTVGHDATNNFIENFPSINRDIITCIPNGIDVDRFSGSAQATQKLLTSDNNVCTIGFFGRFMSQKGFKYLVDAIDIIRKSDLSSRIPQVLTYGWGGFIREEYQAIGERGLAEYFRMMEFTDDMPKAIQNVHLVVMPSLWEACPLLGMEALVAGVPIIGTSCIGLREVLEGSPAVMVPPKNSLALAKAIASEMNETRRAEFEAYVPVAKQRFSLERPSTGLKELYDRIIPE